MKNALLLIAVVLLGAYAKAQHLQDMEFGTDETIDVLTWNVEWFPKNGQTTIDSLKVAIEALDADIIGFQEIADTAGFREMIDLIDGVETYIFNGWSGGLVYTCKDNVQVNALYEIYEESQFWNALPRTPHVLEVEIDGENLVIINNHFKCCGDGEIELGDNDDEEYRRLQASTLLKEYLDLNFANDRVILLGDLNDILTDEEEDNVFQMYLDDDEHYRFADMEIAQMSSAFWSYPSWPSHLDHILVTDELFESLENGWVETIEIDDYFTNGFIGYDLTISDHRPVGFQFNTTPLNQAEVNQHELTLAPSVFIENTRVDFSENLLGGVLMIHNSQGRIVDQFDVRNRSESIKTTHWKPGVYLFSVKLNNEVICLGRGVKRR